MDGVLADFDGQPNAMQRFITEDGFFQKLAPTPLVKKLNDALKNKKLREKVYILSASPTPRADTDKMLWLFEHLPNIELENVIIVRGGQGADQRKAQYANKESILFDDYSGNLMTWESCGGIGIKIINGKNGKGIKWKGARLVIE
jgi:5'(3')-deoxyribonucleotidase